MTDNPELKKSENGSETGSATENEIETEEKPEVAEKEKLLNDEVDFWSPFKYKTNPELLS